jgi:hypothetical protein
MCADARMGDHGEADVKRIQLQLFTVELRSSCRGDAPVMMQGAPVAKTRKLLVINNVGKVTSGGPLNMHASLTRL